MGRSRFGRLGVVGHVGAGFVNPGWRGRLALELANHGPHTVVLTAGETRIVQIVFLELTTPVETPYGERADARYQDQDGVVRPRETEPRSGTE